MLVISNTATNQPAEDERDAPPPGQQRLGAEQGTVHGGDARAEQEPDDTAELRPDGVESPSLRRSVLAQEDDGPGVLAADGEPRGDPEDH
jgi:hypothetical protein